MNRAHYVPEIWLQKNGEKLTTKINTKKVEYFGCFTKSYLKHTKSSDDLNKHACSTN